MLYNIAIMRYSTTREKVRTDEVAFKVRKRAKSRMEALEKALPQIREEVLPIVDPTIKYISVFAGRVGDVTGAAFRLTPIQVVRETGEIRRSK